MITNYYMRKTLDIILVSCIGVGISFFGNVIYCYTNNFFGFISFSAVVSVIFSSYLMVVVPLPRGLKITFPVMIVIPIMVFFVVEVLLLLFRLFIAYNS